MKSEAIVPTRSVESGSLLDTAQSFLLAPYDLEAAQLSQVFGALHAQRID